jgi:hypothetical protein
MKQIMIISIVLISVLIAKNKPMHIPNNAIPNKVKISDIKNGIIKQERIYKINKSKIQSFGKINNNTNDTIIEYTFANGNKFNSKSKIIIKFRSGTTIDVKKLEKKYHLKFIRKMNSGDYLFKNMDGNTLNIINAIVADESLKIERISPNLILNVHPI